MSKIELNDVRTSDDLDAYVNFNDTECKLLGEIKLVLLKRISHAKDYTLKMAKTFTKKTTYGNDGSVIEKCWNAIQDHTKDINNIIYESINRLEKDVMPKLDLIIENKTEIKNKVNEEKRKQDKDLNILKLKHDSAKNDYSKIVAKLNDLKRDYLNRNKKEDKGSKKANEISNYAIKLHIAHNNYLIALKKLNNHNSLFIEKLFPNFLSSQQQIQVNLLTALKTVFGEYYSYLNFSRPKFQEKYDNILHEIVSIDAISNDSIATNANYLNNNHIEFDSSLVPLHNDLIEPELKEDAISITASTINSLNEEKLHLVQEMKKLEEYIAVFEIKCKTLQSDPMQNSITDKIKLIELSKEKLECEILKESKQMMSSELANYVKINRNVPTISLRRSGSRESIKAPQQIPIANSAPTDVQIDDVQIDDFDQPWFHGVLPRDDVEKNLLRSDGDYLVRETTLTGSNLNDEQITTPYVVSIKCMRIDKCEHFYIFQSKLNKKNFIEQGKEFDRISQMLDHYRNLKINHEKDYIKFIRPVLREAWEIYNTDLTIIKEIDSGNFGVVYLGKFKNKSVAIKSMKSCDVGITTEKQEKEKFIAEGRLLQKYNHENIVRFIGIASDTDPIKIVMEYVEGGSLKKYLESNFSIHIQQMLKFCEECASGMEYLEHNKVIHRDLAARNCLLTKDLVLKITDFGLSRELEGDYYKMSCLRPIPVCWSAPECFRRTFSSKSDVWSYGITVWEIFSNGAEPYGNYEIHEVKDRICKGEKLQCPWKAHVRVYQGLMEPCWEMDPKDRPDFTEILININKLLKLVNDLDSK